MEIKFIEKKYFDLVFQSSKLGKVEKLKLVAKMCRLNTFSEIKKAGSGHLGSSFSAMDIITYLYFEYLNIRKLGINSPDRDIFFSSKGHDVPGFYALAYSLGFISFDKLTQLRRLGGLDGHPDITIPSVEANTGSLGMGISKARGMIFAKKSLKHKGRVFVMTGDGEFQEGQNFEALQTTVHQKINNLVVIMDHNKIQTDRPLEEIVSLGELKSKFKAFGWHVIRCNGHDFGQIEKALKEAEKIKDKPKIIICDTIKGKGISFTEHPYALKANRGLYKWHSGAPDDDHYLRGADELIRGITKDFYHYKLPELKFKEIEVESVAKNENEFVADGYGETLCELGTKRPDLVILDADLAGDCRVLEFSRKFPKQFVECGIAEQDMVSMAGGMALQGLSPVTNSFACFLASRANEQIFNNHTENKKVTYACHLAGLIPAGPGKSHQSLRDIALFGVLPNVEIIQASCAKEIKMATKYAIEKAKNSVMLRINAGPSPRNIELPKDYKFEIGKGVTITQGKEFVMMAYGPVMLNEALVAQEILLVENIKLKVINMPWLNRFNEAWIRKELTGCKHLFVLDDHSVEGGLGDRLIDFLNRKELLESFSLDKYGVEGFPACGTPSEVLDYHGLSGKMLAQRIIERINRGNKK